MPVARYCMRKSPGDPWQRNACGDVRIRIDVLWVVVHNELVAYRLSKHEAGNPDENSTSRDDYCCLRNSSLQRPVFCHWSGNESKTCNVRFFMYQTISSDRIPIVLLPSL